MADTSTSTASAEPDRINLAGIPDLIAALHESPSDELARFATAAQVKMLAELVEHARYQTSVFIELQDVLSKLGAGGGGIAGALALLGRKS